ncbi:MAG: porphobilinogen synthase [bacterium]
MPDDWYAETESKMSNAEPRLRRTRKTDAIRKMVRENDLSTAHLMYPLFITEGKRVKQDIASMPGQSRYSIDMLGPVLEDLQDLKIPSVLLYGIPGAKDETGSGAYDEDGIIQKAVRLIKKESPELYVVADVCLCEYTSHGHCGILKNGDVDNDATLELLARTAVAQAAAGADMVAPSAMMDFQVAVIRSALDSEDYYEVPIMAYAAKYASAFYGPFREAAESAPRSGNRKTYQMDPPNLREALREVALDISEGADIVMVKPALAYLDVISMVRSSYDVPIAAYNVSGEYAMVKAAAAHGWIDEPRIVTEILTGIRRAGADILITYHAREVAQWLKESR